ncbi:hypothetical protein TNCV_4051021 [Trichonephila clavipes]|nr:hypothetical protein TNCV_4051021 [Trichonephila clavipes]
MICENVSIMVVYDPPFKAKIDPHPREDITHHTITEPSPWLEPSSQHEILRPVFARRIQVVAGTTVTQCFSQTVGRPLGGRDNSNEGARE